MKRQTIALIIAIVGVLGLIYLLEEPTTPVERLAPLVKKNYPPAPELAGIAGYINTNNITLKDLVGKKVVLLDVWTYTCINCQRTLPYLTMWYNKYEDQGLEIIGIHSPEFEFEKKQENVERAVRKFNITYPVVLDNDHITWRALRNRYWPAKYLVDIDGYIVWSHFGEGSYDEAERKIQGLLLERKQQLGIKEDVTTTVSELPAAVDFTRIGTPEIYLGYDFTRGNFGNPEGLPEEETVTYTLPSRQLPNNVYLEGTWHVGPDHVRLESGAGKVVLTYTAKKANIVAAGNSTLATATKTFSVTEEDLYTPDEHDDYGTYHAEINVTGKGFRLYTFTFG